MRGAGAWFREIYLEENLGARWISGLQWKQDQGRSVIQDLVTRSRMAPDVV